MSVFIIQPFDEYLVNQSNDARLYFCLFFNTYIMHPGNVGAG